MFSTRLSSSSLLTGLLRKSSQPAATARSMSPSSFSAVTIRIMMLLGGRVALERLADLEAAELGHHDVQQDQVGLERGHLVERVAGRRRPRRSRSPGRPDRPPAARRSGSLSSAIRISAFRPSVDARLSAESWHRITVTECTATCEQVNRRLRSAHRVQSASTRTSVIAAARGTGGTARAPRRGFARCDALVVGRPKRFENPAADAAHLVAAHAARGQAPACRCGCPTGPSACAGRRGSCSC